MLIIPMRCIGKNCGRAFIGGGSWCDVCQRRIAFQARGTARADMRALRRERIRARLGLPA